METVGDNTVCGDCASNNYSFCDDCEKYHNNDDVYNTTSGTSICIHCIENSDFTACENCGDYGDDLENTATEPDEEAVYWCPRCIRRNRERTITTEEQREERDRRERERIASRLYGYHSTEGRKNRAQGEVYRVGVEVEKEDSKAREYIAKRTPIQILKATGWVIERDGSLDCEIGFEAVSPILPLMNRAKLSANLQKVKKLINAQRTARCGGHIHISSTQKRPEQLLTDVFRGYLPLFYALYPERGSNRYCQIKNWKQYGGDHYCAFNVRQDTLEIRFFPSPKNINVLEWRFELLRIMVQKPRRYATFVLKDMLNRGSELYKHLRKVYTDEQVLQKCRMFATFASNIDRIKENPKLIGTIEEQLKGKEIGEIESQ